MATKKKTAKAKRHEREIPGNLVAAFAVIGLVGLAYFDLQNTAAEIPNFIYYGLIGSMLGAKWESIKGWFRGRDE